MRVRTILLTAVAGTFAVLALAAAPIANAVPSDTASGTTGAYPPPTPCATSVLSGTFAPGATLKIQSTGFEPNGAAQIWLNSTPVLLLNTTADASGTVTATAHIPADLPPGAHTIEVKMPSRTCTLALTSDTGVDASSSARNEPPVSTDTGSRSLAFTGFSAITSLVVVAVLLVSGVLFLVLGHRRRT